MLVVSDPADWNWYLDPKIKDWLNHYVGRGIEIGWWVENRSYQLLETFHWVAVISRCYWMPGDGTPGPSIFFRDEPGRGALLFKLTWGGR